MGFSETDRLIAIAKWISAFRYLFAAVFAGLAVYLTIAALRCVYEHDHRWRRYAVLASGSLALALLSDLILLFVG